VRIANIPGETQTRSNGLTGMVQQPAHSIIVELEDAVAHGPPAKRVRTLRQVTDLFLQDAARFSDDQVKVFDDVLCLLVARVEIRARAELSKRLAPVDYAPFEVIQHLAGRRAAAAGDRTQEYGLAVDPWLGRIPIASRGDAKRENGD
jgi:hypothetical protein